MQIPLKIVHFAFKNIYVVKNQVKFRILVPMSILINCVGRIAFRKTAQEEKLIGGQGSTAKKNYNQSPGGVRKEEIQQ